MRGREADYSVLTLEGSVNTSDYYTTHLLKHLWIRVARLIGEGGGASVCVLSTAGVLIL